MGQLFLEIKWTRSSNEKYTFPMSIKLLSFYHFIQRELKWAGTALQIINFVKSFHSEHFNIKTQFWRDLTWKNDWVRKLRRTEVGRKYPNRNYFYKLVISKLNCLAWKSLRPGKSLRFLNVNLSQGIMWHFALLGMVNGRFFTRKERRIYYNTTQIPFLT